jgi:hypothetical protein
MGDRNDLALWWDGGKMIQAVAAVNKNTIVVIHSVGPVKCAPRFLPFIPDVNRMPQHELVEPSEHHGYHLCRRSG